ncbi:DEAD/DEAH box helicase family protein [Chlamydiales bacterium]|nr:DEAD/DEAH box helicase family protein [Chlamydiales bacterium]
MTTTKFPLIFQTSKDWQDFNHKISYLSPKDKGICFELLTKYYLTINSKYRSTLTQVWLLEEVPENVKTHLNLPECDEGIDLIAETKEGDYWAVQCKYRSTENSSLSRRELSTFTDLSFNICKNISHALICTNSKKLSHKFSLYNENISFCASDVWCSLNDHFFDNIRNLLKGVRVEPILFSPRKHQQKALENAIKHFKDNSRGKLIHPCSAGKTLTAYWIARALEAKTILVTVPSLSLINQMLEVWTNQFIRDGIEVSWICVCSDETVKNISVDSDEVEARDLGIEVFTCPKAISTWASKTKSQVRVVFSTYQSGMTLSEAAKTSAIDFDLAIMDEAHKTVGQKGGLFTHLLDDQNIKVSKRLFMTATERRFKGTSDEILSMEQEEVYGQTFDLYTFKDAISDGILSDYKIATIQVTQAEIKSLIEGNFYVRPQNKSWKSDIESQMLGSLIALRKAYEKYGFSHAISYHSSLARANSFKEAQVLYGQLYLNGDSLRVFHVKGTTPAGQRVKIFKDFIAAQHALITNARCLTEGVNIPKIDSILFADPKKSKVDIVQAVGRALRPHKDKRMSYIIVPVLVDEDVDDLDSIQSKTFEAVLQILKALASQDERIIEYFQAISSSPKRGIPRDFSPFEVDIPINKAIDLQKFYENISLLLWDKLAKISKRPFEEAKSFVNVLGLKNHEEWKAYCNGQYANLPPKPQDIPRAPWIAYENQGWVSMGDWLGTGFIATSKREYRSFYEAREFVHRLKLKSQAEWVKYCRGVFSHVDPKPDDIPYDPANVYKNDGWINLGDWLGTNAIATRNLKFRSFEEALNFTHSLGLKTQTEWKKFCRGELLDKGVKPDDIPANPNITYKDCGWINYGHWLGTGYVSPRYREYRSYMEARDYTHKLGLKSYKDWRAYCDGKYPDKPLKPEDIPAKPDGTYKGKGWTNWGDFLGSGNVANGEKTFLSYEEAKAVIQRLNMTNQKDWKAYCEGTNPKFGLKPDNIPKAPDQYYSEWSSWGEWLGTGYVACSKREYLSFDEARSFVHSLGLCSQHEWRSYTKGKLKELPPLPANIPANPNQTYKNEGWISMGDWLGTGYIACSKRKYLPFLEARSFVRKLELNNQQEWKLYCKGELEGHKKKPDNIPSVPHSTYKNEGWVSLGDWLGTGVVAFSQREYLSYEEARQFVHKLKLLNTTDWASYCNGELAHLPQKPDNITNRPEITYKSKGWVDWADWLGASYIPTRRTYRAFEDARDFVRKLNLITQSDWKLYCQGQIDGVPKIPQDIPLKPERTYRELGWKGYPDWLGNTRRASPRFISYLSFAEAKTFVRSLSLKNHKEWSDYCKGKREDLGEKPQNIPTHPDRAYKDLGWCGYGDWLGTDTPAPGSREFLPYEEAKAFVHKLGLNSRSEWNQYCSGKFPDKPPLPESIPKDPNSVYKNKGWLGVGDWLGTFRKATHLKSYLAFEEARSFVRKLNLQNRDGWKSFCKGELLNLPHFPENIPKAPWIVYKKSGWISLSDWLGN